ncbi:MAG: hypothetical protein WDN08_19400 [Rhizomicrobium sp.]
MTNKTAKLAGALFAALTVATALGATPAAAAPHNIAPHGGGMTGGFHQPDALHDRGHRPPQRVEYRTRQPHGHYRWHGGNWNWSRDHWVWAPGIWLRF